MLLSTIGLIGAGVSAGIGGIGSAVNNKRAKDEANRAYREAKGYLETEYYRDPLTAVGNKALLKSLDDRMKDQNEALRNRSVAAGATMENQLAARKANNEVMSNVYSNLLQGEDARRRAINQQKLQLGQNYSANVQNSLYKSAQDWQTWGSQMANAALAYGSTGLLDGTPSGENSKITADDLKGLKIEYV